MELGLLRCNNDLFLVCFFSEQFSRRDLGIKILTFSLDSVNGCFLFQGQDILTFTVHIKGNSQEDHINEGCFGR